MFRKFGEVWIVRWLFWFWRFNLDLMLCLGLNVFEISFCVFVYMVSFVKCFDWKRWEGVSRGWYIFLSLILKILENSFCLVDFGLFSIRMWNFEYGDRKVDGGESVILVLICSLVVIGIWLWVVFFFLCWVEEWVFFDSLMDFWFKIK